MRRGWFTPARERCGRSGYRQGTRGRALPRSRCLVNPVQTAFGRGPTFICRQAPYSIIPASPEHSRRCSAEPVAPSVSCSTVVRRRHSSCECFKRRPAPRLIITDKLRSHRAAIRKPGTRAAPPTRHRVINPRLVEPGNQARIKGSLARPAGRSADRASTVLPLCRGDQNFF